MNRDQALPPQTDLDVRGESDRDGAGVGSRSRPLEHLCVAGDTTWGTSCRSGRGHAQQAPASLVAHAEHHCSVAFSLQMSFSLFFPPIKTSWDGNFKHKEKQTGQSDGPPGTAAGTSFTGSLVLPVSSPTALFDFFEVNSRHNCICLDYCKHFGMYILFFFNLFIMENFKCKGREVYDDPRGHTHLSPARKCPALASLASAPLPHPPPH